MVLVVETGEGVFDDGKSAQSTTDIERLQRASILGSKGGVDIHHTSKGTSTETGRDGAGAVGLTLRVEERRCGSGEDSSRGKTAESDVSELEFWLPVQGLQSNKGRKRIDFEFNQKGRGTNTSYPRPSYNATSPASPHQASLKKRKPPSIQQGNPHSTMKKLLSTLGLDSLLPLYSRTSPFSTPHHSRPSSPNATSQRSSSRSHSRASSRASTKQGNSSTPSGPTNPDIADLKSAADWEYPASPFTQQQSSPRPVPFREHSSSSIVTIKVPTAPQGRARSRARCGVRRGKVEVQVQVPEIRISNIGCGEKEKVKGRGKEGKAADATLGMNVNQGCVWRYRRHRGVLIQVDGTEYKNAGMWKGLANAGVTGVKIPMKWSVFGGVDPMTEIDRLNVIISTAKSYGLGVLLEHIHPQPRDVPEDTPDLRALANIAEEVLKRHENIVGMELSLSDAGEVVFERNLKIWSGILNQNNLPIYVPVYVGSGEGRERMEWVKKMGNGVVINVVLDSGAELLKGLGLGKGVDWVLTTQDKTVWEKVREEGVQTWYGFAGCWVGKEDVSFGHEVRTMTGEEILICAGRVKGELQSGAVRDWVERRGDEGREAFEQGWEAGFSDAVGFWRGVGVEGESGEAVGLGLINMDNVYGDGDGGACAGESGGARIGCLEGWIGRRVRGWVDAKGKPEREGKEVRGVREFAEGVRCGVGAFERDVIATRRVCE
ncbi:hypothetical protein BGX38DRAFT_1273301 [Terfezia claveryi]|nr:hypothetical protein BGX38DRAFT_1273301 [Terfezia claveryi]